MVERRLQCDSASPLCEERVLPAEKNVIVLLLVETVCWVLMGARVGARDGVSEGAREA